MASIVLQDADLIPWQLDIVVTNGTPAWHSVQIESGIGQVILLAANANNHYQLAVDLAGNIDTLPTQERAANGYVLGSNDCTTGWLIEVDPSGNILLTQIVPWDPGPVVGQLFPTDDTNGPWSQPGGIGTQVFPAQPIGERIGLFTASCEHWFNSWLIQSTTVCGVRSALICCPLCCIIQQIVTPFELIYTDAFAIILG